MYGRQDNSSDGSSSQVPPPWLVRAEVTIRHGDAVTSETVQMPPGTTTTADAGGIRMICRWNTGEPNATSTPAAAASDAFRTSSSGGCPGGFGFQRGNILFTSTPPERPSQRSSSGSYTLPRSSPSGNNDSTSSRGRTNISDSGYNSEQFSYSSLPTRRPSQQYNRRCKSTCSIVLSTASADKASLEKPEFAESTKISSDSWHRRPSHQHVFSRHHFSTVPEVCEDCAEGSTSSTFTTHFCTRVAEKTVNNKNNKATAISKDAASQTTDIESARSSSTVSKSSRIKRTSGTGVYQSNEQKKKEEILSPPASTRTTSSGPAADSEKSDSSAKEDSSKRKSRTVHIDVYCTGSDDASTDDTTSEDERSTPMTVFENEDVKVTHTQAASDLPRGFQDVNAFLKRSAERRCASFRNAPMRMPSLASTKGYDSDEVLSSLYPSRFSSYSGIRDLDSVPWSAASSSTALSPCEYDSATVTSSKDTFSDIDSLMNSKSGLTPCDSFEYANSSDRDRIRKMDTSAKTDNEKSKTWRSPQIERKHLLQNRKMREYFKKHEIGWSSGESEAEDSDESGAVGWSFMSGDGKSRLVKKDSIVRRVSAGQTAESNAIDFDSRNKNAQEERSQFAAHDYVPHSNILRDRIGPFGSKSPSPLPSTIPSRVTSPFTTPYGERTDHIVKASKFGTVISAFRKPGHHIGPSKNPTCSCEHCRRYFEETRGRSFSLSELERHPVFNLRKK
ncbi:dentin sialophosphoprotein [Linepithema humile]|uniref:dentin sialophosphoprotein n=1 Tax=Linepithema humile TaxID=83485 RepID=UPI00351E601A